MKSCPDFRRGMFFILLIVGLGLFFETTFLAGEEAAPKDIDRAYLALQDAYQAREEGDDDLSREKMADALSIFREIADRKSPSLIKSSSDLTLEEENGTLKLVENRSLFKFEFKTDLAIQNRLLEQQDQIFRQQQLILQKLALIARENSEIKAGMVRVESHTKEIETIGDDVSDIQADTSEIPDMQSTLDDISDSTEEIPDIADSVDDISDNTNDIPDIADDIGDLRDDVDILEEILSVVEDIKDDTQEIPEVKDGLDDVKDGLEGSD